MAIACFCASPAWVYSFSVFVWPVSGLVLQPKDAPRDRSELPLRRFEVKAVDQLHPNQCIGDMCVPAHDGTLSSFLPHQEFLLNAGEDQEPPLRPACRNPVPPENRVMLMPVVAQFHGSTALEGLFMSSPHITTLCSSGAWQCEAHSIYEARNQDLKSAKDMLFTYSAHWDLSQPVLLDKGPRDFRKIQWEQAELEREKQSMLPGAMMSIGIQHVYFVYVLMWRPVCLSLLSHHARTEIDGDVQAFAESELLLLEDMVEAHRYLSSYGYKIMVLSLADVLWRPDRSQRRLNEFLPCLGTLDFNFTPQMNKDIFPGNKWKADGSVKQYGESTHPWDCCKYAVEERSCNDDANYFHALAPDLQERAHSALEYLLALS